MDSWEDLADEPEQVVQDSWEDIEDAEDPFGPVKPAADAKKPAPEKKAQPAASASKKTSKKTKNALAERDRLDREKAEAEAAAGAAALKRAEEEADLRNLTDLVGADETSRVGELDRFVPHTKKDFETYGKLLGEKGQDFSTSPFYVDLVSEACRVMIRTMKTDEMRKVIAVMNTALNEHIRAAKNGQPSAASKAKKREAEQRAKAMALKQLDEEVDEEAEDEYEKYADKYDFM